MSNLLTTCEQAARIGGQVLLDWRKRFSVREKGPADLVTEADLAAQEAIRDFLATARPDHAFVGEETPGALDIVARGDRSLWVVDPLDGTTNYVHGLPNYATSVALLEQGRPIVGAVFDPVARECFLAARGEGAWVSREARGDESSNGGGVLERLSASGQGELAKSLVAVSFPAQVSAESDEIRDFLAVLPHCQAFRRMGSAALNLCYVAAGMIDAYWATSTKIWDIAAGALIAEEAGAVTVGLAGEPLRLAEGKIMAASTIDLAHQVIALLGQRRTLNTRHTE